MNPSDVILNSWHANADQWIATIANDELESRRLVTNEAIVNAVLSAGPRKLLDLGCGEGWLSRRLRREGINVWGTDAVPALVQAAVERDGPFYSTQTYQEIAAGKHTLPTPFGAVVINFALLDKDDTEAVLHSLHDLLVSGGVVAIQTLHSLAVASDGPYASGWREVSWAGLKRDFVQPYRWYFRTLEDWLKLFRSAGFALMDLKEPIHPSSGQPLSYLFTLQSTTRP